MAKRLFDVLLSFSGLVVLSPLFLVVVLLIKLDSPGPVLFRQIRIGRNFAPFVIYKFRTMIDQPDQKEIYIAATQREKITSLGRILRKAKIDELPQLINVFKGEMSFVGPRPEAQRFVEIFRRDYEEILKVRPGITDLASIEYHQEGEILGNATDPDKMYISKILPDKIRLAKEYLKRSSFFFDLSLIVKTVLRIIWSRGRAV